MTWGQGAPLLHVPANGTANPVPRRRSRSLGDKAPRAFASLGPRRCGAGGGGGGWIFGRGAVPQRRDVAPVPLFPRSVELRHNPRMRRCQVILFADVLR